MTTHICSKDAVINEMKKEIADLKTDVAVAKENINVVKQDINETKDNVKELKIDVKNGFDKIEQKNQKLTYLMVSTVVGMIGQILLMVIAYFISGGGK